MNNDIRLTKEIIDEAGSISGPCGLKVEVRFDLIELQDFIDGVAGRKHSYGHLRFRDQLEPSIVLLLLSKSRLILTGGGIQAALCLYRLNSITVAGPIDEISSGDNEVASRGNRHGISSTWITAKP